eukprot:scaffold36254_cov79-Isochrysis_galbana.AAC.1
MKRPGWLPAALPERTRRGRVVQNSTLFWRTQNSIASHAPEYTYPAGVFQIPTFRLKSSSPPNAPKIGPLPVHPR